MSAITACALPADALLIRYRAQGAYTDCFCVEIDAAVSFEQYVVAFYTSLPFKLERLILGLAVKAPSTDAQTGELGRGERDRFAAWSVEQRAENQLLLCDLHGSTRSWLMIKVLTGAGQPRTRLYFGSAVVTRRDPRTGEIRIGAIYRALLGFHKLYSRILIAAAQRQLLRSR